MGHSAFLVFRLCTIFSGKQEKYIKISEQIEQKSSEYHVFKKGYVKTEKNRDITLRLWKKVDII